MTNSTDIQQRETIARIVDPRIANEEWVANYGASENTFGGTLLEYVRGIALAKADAILALRFNPQPGSEGLPPCCKPTNEELFARYSALGEWVEKLANTPMNLSLEDWGTFIDEIGNALAEAEYRPLAAAPTPPTAQDQAGEEFIEFKEALSDIRMLRKEHIDLNGGGPGWSKRHADAWAKVDELFAEEDEAAWDRHQEGLNQC